MSRRGLGRIVAEIQAENADIYMFEEMLEKGDSEPVKDSLNVEK